MYEVDPKDWKHIPRPYNPPDLPSRGCSAAKLLSLRWWVGSICLRLDEKD
ncbi:hypothetical protein X975_15304, partial [Stegodyphus mimosarum]